MPTQIKQCDCKNEFQDKIYGKGMRVHNESNKGCKCTCCGKIRK